MTRNQQARRERTISAVKTAPIIKGSKTSVTYGGRWGLFHTQWICRNILVHLFQFLLCTHIKMAATRPDCGLIIGQNFRKEDPGYSSG